MEDVYNIIWKLTAITGKRAFACVSSTTRKLFKDKLAIAELEFQKMINRTCFLTDVYYSGFYDTMHKRTIELIYDNCSHLIPDSYIVHENRVLYGYGNICKMLGKNGDLKMIERLSKVRITSYNIECIANGAASVGNMAVLGLMCEKGYMIMGQCILCAIKGNQIEMLKWLLEKSAKSFVDIPSFAVKHAVKKNNMEMIEFLVLEKKCETTYAGYNAAFNGRLDIVKFLFNHVPEGYKQQFLYDVRSGAICGGHLDVLEFAFGQGYSLEADYVPCTDINILRWLVEKKYVNCNQKVLEYLAMYGNWECFEYFLELLGLISDGHLVRKDLQSVLTGSIQGHNEIIAKFLLERGCPYDKFIISLAMDRSNGPDGNAFSMLKLFKVTEWPSSVFRTASASGNLNILQHGHDNNCINGQEIKRDIMNTAVANGHLHIIIWARKHGYEWDVVTIVKADEVNIFKWLRNIDNYRAECKLISKETEICPWDEQVCLNAIKYRNLLILKMAMENGCEYGDATFNAAKTCRSDEIKEYVASKISR